MGTDIHMYVETRQEDGSWKAISGPNPILKQLFWLADNSAIKGDKERAEMYHNKIDAILTGIGKEQYLDEWEQQFYTPTCKENWIYSGRNYNLFAILANVRNGYGFAGIETGTGFNIIADPRGLPEDASEEVKEKFDATYLHDISHISLRELLDFDWNQKSLLYGYVTEEVFDEWLQGDPPSSYSGDVSGSTLCKISNEEMEEILLGTFPKEPGKSYYTRVAWGESYGDVAGNFYIESIPTLQELSKDPGYEDVRIVFGFDS